jgi:uncharacterized membrane protein YeaQ/YmgE (transglycosylase-associated protein family)
MNFFWMLIIGITAGWLAGHFMTGRGFGVVGDMITGMIGAVIGGILFRESGILTSSGLVGSVIIATTGAIIFLYGVRLIRRV